MRKRHNHILEDVIVIVLSVFAAILLAQTGVLASFLSSTKEIGVVGSFITGIFFTSIFTVTPATVVLAQLTGTHSILTVALLGGLGALLGDLVIFKCFKNNVADDLLFLAKLTKTERLFSIFKLRLFRRLVPLIGALIIASPLPDELGLAMMGLSKVRTSLFIPISFAMNFLGILIIGLVVKFALS